jgi:50S ribosomal subunit-associated GTPase HflX
VAAATGDGLPELRNHLEEVLQRQGVAIDLELPYGVVGEVEALRARTGIQVAYEDAALHVTGFAPTDVAAELQQLKRRAIGRVL